MLNMSVKFTNIAQKINIDVHTYIHACMHYQVVLSVCDSSFFRTAPSTFSETSLFSVVGNKDFICFVFHGHQPIIKNHTSTCTCTYMYYCLHQVKQEEEIS